MCSKVITCVYSFPNSFPISVITEDWVEFPAHQVGLCWLSVSSIAVCTRQSQTPNLSFLFTPSPYIHSLSQQICFHFINKFLHLFFSDCTYKCYHITFVFLCLTYFIWYDSLQVQPCCCKCHYFTLFNGWVIFHCIFELYLLYSSPITGHLGYFQVLAIINSTALNTGVHVSFWTMVFSGYMPRDGIPGSCGSSLFSLLRNLYTVLHSGGTNVLSHQQYRRGPFSPHPLQDLLFADFFIMVFLKGALSAGGCDRRTKCGWEELPCVWGQGQKNCTKKIFTTQIITMVWSLI